MEKSQKCIYGISFSGSNLPQHQQLPRKIQSVCLSFYLSFSCSICLSIILILYFYLSFCDPTSCFHMYHVSFSHSIYCSINHSTITSVILTFFHSIYCSIILSFCCFSHFIYLSIILSIIILSFYLIIPMFI